LHRRFVPIHHAHGPEYHDEYTFEHKHHDHEKAEAEITAATHTYYDADTYKRHAQKPSFNMDMGGKKPTT